MSEIKAMLIQVIGGLAIAIFVLVSVAFGAEKPILPTDAKIDSVIARAARRADQKLNARWMALLDSIIVEIHEQFVVEHKNEIGSLQHKEAIRCIKKRLLKAASAESRVSADSSTSTKCLWRKR